MPHFPCPICKNELDAPASSREQVIVCRKCLQAVRLPGAPVAALIVTPLPEAGPAARPVRDVRRRGPTLRCWRCGIRTPEEDAERRDVSAGGSTSLLGLNPFRLDNWLLTSHYARVDLCPPCAERHDEAARFNQKLINIGAAVLVGAILLFTLVVAVRA